MAAKLKLVLSFCLAAGAVSAAICSSNVPGNGATYFSGGYSCSVGDLLFSNFSYTASGTNEIHSDQVTVDTSPYGLSFNAPWIATTGMVSDATIGFTITGLDGALIENLGLIQTSGVSGLGSAGVNEDGCGPAPCDATGGAISVDTYLSGNTMTVQNEASFSPLSSVVIEEDINVDGNSGFALISAVQDTFDAPEPGSTILVSSGVLLVGLLRPPQKRNTALLSSWAAVNLKFPAGDLSLDRKGVKNMTRKMD